MKFGTIGFIKIYCYHDLSSSGFTIKPKVYGPSLRSAVYRRPKSMTTSHLLSELKMGCSEFRKPEFTVPSIAKKD